MEVRYLGNMGSKKGIIMDPDKDDVVRECGKPTGLTETKAFLHFVEC